MLGAAAAVLFAAATPAPLCVAPTSPAQPVTVQGVLTIDRHGRHLLAPPPGEACSAVGAQAAKGSPASEALEEIQAVMLGVRYFERHGRRAPKVYLNLEGLKVTATGTLACERDDRCRFELLELRDVVYPEGFENDD